MLLERRALRIVGVVALGAASCGFGHSIDRSDSIVTENRGANRYIYRSTSLVKESPRGPAKPALGVAPTGGREIGLIEVTADYSGLGAGGLRDSEVEFFPELAEVAGRMGGTNFLVLRSTRETRFGTGWISSLTVDVFDTLSAGAVTQ